jgi:hypothetical protein
MVFIPVTSGSINIFCIIFPAGSSIVTGPFLGLTPNISCFSLYNFLALLILDFKSTSPSLPANNKLSNASSKNLSYSCFIDMAVALSV